ncbi:MAG: CapA family protein [Pseudomonadota bacterium]
MARRQYAWVFCLLLGMACCCKGKAVKSTDTVEAQQPDQPSMQKADDAAPASSLDHAQEGSGQRPPGPLYLIVGGDVMLQMQLIEIVALQPEEENRAGGWKKFFHALEPILAKVEKGGETALIVNLESPVAEERQAPTSYPPVFNGPAEALEGMKLAGVDYVTMANNHAFDQGRAGLGETMEAVRGAGLGIIGAGDGAGEARKPVFVGDGKTVPRVAVLSYLLRPGDKGKEPEEKPAIALLDEASPGEVSQAAGTDGVDAVVVIIHWIGEFVEKPRKAWKDAVEGLVGAGADAVVCHGPHVVGPAEWIEKDGRKGFVAWSLGNLVANFGWEVYPTNTMSLQEGKTSAQRKKTRCEALAVLELVRSADESGSALTKVSLYPLWLEDNRYASFRKGGAARAIFPMPIPSCSPEQKTGCPAGAKKKECPLRWEMIFEAGRTMVEGLWGKPWPGLQPCDEGLDAIDLPPMKVEFVF